jgi:threonine dehydrogenase-like Zn-dependent dehydrogenase
MTISRIIQSPVVAGAGAIGSFALLVAVVFGLA